MLTEEDVLRRTCILVLGHRRPSHLRNVLESLRRQSALSLTHVWLDGHQGFAELDEPTLACQRVAREYRPARVTALNGHVGIEKLMLDALGVLCREWEAIIVLEDDCFPTRTAVAEFASALAAVRDRQEIFSVYGHHFLVPGEEQPFPRFQGWGWAGWSARLLPVIAEARRCFDMPEPEFLAWVREQLTPEVRGRLSVTPGRDPIAVAETFFAWDACFSLLTARRGLLHCRTAKRVVFNCGMGEGSSHFPEDDSFRLPPYNMISPGEVFDYFEDSGDTPSIEATYRDCAIVYVASNHVYAEEALASACSARRAMPGIAIYLKIGTTVTAAGARWNVFDRIVAVDDLKDGYIGKYCFLEGLAHERILFLDSDAYVVSDLKPGFDLLRKFDVACAHAPFRLAAGPGCPEIPRPPEIPSAFPDLNSGVIFCRNNDRVRRLLSACCEAYSGPAADVETTPDQPALRTALWESDVSLYVLPPEYNARLCFPAFLSGEAKILHCRFADMEQVAARVNANLHIRTFLPEELGDPL